MDNAGHQGLTRRARLGYVAVAFVVGASAFAAAAYAGGDDGEQRAESPDWYVPTGATPMEECDAMPVAYAKAPYRVLDHATGKTLEKPRIEWCRAAAEVTPTDAVLRQAGLVAVTTVSNGNVHVAYHELVTDPKETTRDIMAPSPLPEDQAMLRIAASEAELGP